jgi:hypothetical protein
MEFKEYGPLAQSKMTTENNKSSWVPMVLMLGLGVIIGVAYINIVNENQNWNKVV